MTRERLKQLRNVIFTTIIIFVMAFIMPSNLKQVFAEDVGTSACEEAWNDGEVAKQATCEKDGEIIFTCSCCGNTKTEVIPMISGAKLQDKQYVYSGKEETPSVTSTDSKGNVLVLDTDYTVSYAAGRTQVGCYEVTVIYCGKYSGTEKLSFSIVPKAPENVSAKLYRLSQVGGHDDVKFTWEKSEGATGYLVYYKKASASTWSKAVTTTETSYTKKNLSDGVKYTFKVVPYYKSASNTKYYSDQQYKTANVTTKEAGRFITKSGKKYYEYYKGGYANGKYAKSKFLTVNSKTYYFNNKGVMHTGWIKLSGNYYYLDRKTGVQKKNCKIDGIKIQKNGKAVNTTLNKNKIDVMITARKKVQSITKVSDTKEQKLKKVFKWVMDKPYKKYRILPLARQKKGWEVTYANDIFKKGNGCCVSEACALAFLTKECGYTKVYVADDTEHAWMELNGRVYDSLFAVSKSYKTYYNGTYKKAKLWCHNKKEI